MSENQNQSQADTILGELKRVRGEWVSMPTLAHLAECFAVHSRISELRGRGEEIECRTVRDGRKVQSYYRIPDNGQLGLI